VFLQPHTYILFRIVIRIIFYRSLLRSQWVVRRRATPISKTARIEKIFLRKILCRKNKKSPISRKPQPPKLRIFLHPKSDKQKNLQDMIASFLPVFF